MNEIRRLERGRFQLVDVNMQRAHHPALSVEYETAWVRSRSGATTILSGPPPVAWNMRLDIPPKGVDPTRVEEEVLRLVVPRADSWWLRYFERRATRLVIGTSVESHPVELAVWALTGHVMTRGGRLVSIGRSGNGSGIRKISTEEAQRSLGWRLEAVDRAEATESSRTPAVLGPAASAVLVHEAVGHFAEASTNVELGHRLGVRVAPEFVDLTDDPLAEGGVARYAVDDEGVASLSPTCVVRGGRLINLLHSLESAAQAGTSSTANGRAASVWHSPAPRMSNLICSTGAASEEELIDTMGSGIYIHSLSDGYAFGNRVQARIGLAERVERGRRTGGFLVGGTVSEDRFLLTRTLELGEEARYSHNAMCGKGGQVLYDIGTRTPAFRMSRLAIQA